MGISNLGPSAYQTEKPDRISPRTTRVHRCPARVLWNHQTHGSRPTGKSQIVQLRTSPNVDTETRTAGTFVL